MGGDVRVSPGEPLVTRKKVNFPPEIRIPDLVYRNLG
jgi:hypothetical protein